jgi:hypothetical protein
MKARYPKRPSQKAVRNLLGFFGGKTEMEPSVKRGRQQEGLTNDAISEWRSLHPELVLHRNKRRLATPVGHNQPIMLGWGEDGAPDWIGYRSVLITPGMVNTRIAQFVGIEAKRADGGVVSDAQEKFLNALKDAGGVAGVARNADDAEELLR